MVQWRCVSVTVQLCRCGVVVNPYENGRSVSSAKSASEGLMLRCSCGREKDGVEGPAHEIVVNQEEERRERHARTAHIA